jgi:hypothetical protein
MPRANSLDVPTSSLPEKLCKALGESTTGRFGLNEQALKCQFLKQKGFQFPALLSVSVVQKPAYRFRAPSTTMPSAGGSSRGWQSVEASFAWTNTNQD